MNGKSILVVAAHPDDEVLGVGGTIARHVAQGDTVHILFLFEGVTSRHVNPEAPEALLEIERREQMAREAAKVLGAGTPLFHRYPNLRHSAVDTLLLNRVVGDVVQEAKPTIVYTHFGNDMNADHRLTHEAVLAACRPKPGLGVEAIYTFETASSTEWAIRDFGPMFAPTRFIDVTAFVERKMAALRCYDSEMWAAPNARSYEAVDAMMTIRGADVGIHKAEAFAVVREIVA